MFIYVADLTCHFCSHKQEENMMNSFDIGSCFDSYRELIENLSTYCSETGTKFWKRDCKLISSNEAKDALVYKEIKFVCVHSGTPKTNERKLYDKLNCPAYFRFKAIPSGCALQLIALNYNHNHLLGQIDYEAEFLNLKELNRLKRPQYENEETVKRIRLKIETEDDVQNNEEYIDIFIDNTTEQNVQFNFKGLIAPVFTVFNNDQSVNTSSILKYAQFLAKSDIHGVLVHGTTGEGTSLNVQERKLLVEEWVKAVKQTGQHIMVQVGGAPLPDVIALAKHAESLGVDSLLCLPELYFKPTNEEELANYLKIVGEAAPNTPLLYYHIPMFTNVNVHMGKFLNYVTGKIATFKGIKFTSNNLDEGMEAVKANNGKYSVFLGADTLMAGGFSLGFDSAIATTLNIFPQYGVEILKAINESRLKDAQEIQNKLTEVTNIVTKHGAWVPTMKVAMNMVTPINVGYVRPPLKNVTKEQESEMKNMLKDFM